MKSYTVTTKTPMGQLMLTESNGFITQCRFTKDTPSLEKASPVLRAALRQLEDYFAGQHLDFDLPLAPSGTPFQEKVWTTLQNIPYGDKWSYQQLAQQVGSPKAYRAVGTANAKNPICIIIPCHRVILASGKPGSYAGGEDVKIQLLALEQRGAAIAAA